MLLSTCKWIERLLNPVNTSLTFECIQIQNQLYGVQKQAHTYYFIYFIFQLVDKCLHSSFFFFFFFFFEKYLYYMLKESYTSGLF
jgi:hypothetical protein